MLCYSYSQWNIIRTIISFMSNSVGIEPADICGNQLTSADISWYLGKSANICWYQLISVEITSLQWDTIHFGWIFWRFHCPNLARQHGNQFIVWWTVITKGLMLKSRMYEYNVVLSNYWCCAYESGSTFTNMTTLRESVRLDTEPIRQSQILYLNLDCSHTLCSIHPTGRLFFVF